MSQVRGDLSLLERVSAALTCDLGQSPWHAPNPDIGRRSVVLTRQGIALAESQVRQRIVSGVRVGVPPGSTSHSSRVP